MEEPQFELRVAPAPNAVPVQLPIVKVLTSIGSDPEADIRLHTAPPQWAIIHRGPAEVELRLISTGSRHRLVPGERFERDGISVELISRSAMAAHDLALDELAGALASVDTPDRALQLILQGVIRAAQADTGAIIITDEGAYTVAAALSADGTVLSDAADLLSDTIVRDVLGTGERVHLDDIGANARYASIPSVVSLQLRAVVCLPMRLEGRTLGALFLGKRDRRSPFSDQVAGELKVLAAMAVPFLAQLRRTGAPRADVLLGESPPMREVQRLIERVAPSDLSVLLLGASGTGKEIVARAIHAASPRANRPLIALNCASVPESLLGAELFGYKKGAFTGANADRKGLIETAHGSTLFLDEVGDMPLTMQAALLRVIEQREVKRLGENFSRSVDFRLISATNRALSGDHFRDDLLFRLKEMTLELPPLATRGNDITLLAHAFLRQAERQLSLPLHRLAPSAEALLRSYQWPGNVRELKATMRRAAILADAHEITPADLQLTDTDATAPTALSAPQRPLAEARDEFIRSYVAAAVQRCNGDREAAAEALGIGVRTLYRHLS